MERPNEANDGEFAVAARRPALPLWKRLTFVAIVLVVSITLTVGVLEFIARFYANEIALKGRLFQSDPEFGYTLRPEIKVRRRLSDGTVYTVATDSEGRRVTPGRPDEPVWRAGAQRRVLIVGDSFAEGFVEIEGRMDRVMERLRPEWATTAIGVSGFGTNQEFALASRYYDSMKPGDVVLLLTCGNDFYDLIRRSNSGRAKSYVALEGGRLVEKPPELGLASWLRDKSVLAGFVIVRLFPMQQPTREQLEEGSRIYAALVEREAARLKARDLRLLIAHHTDHFDDMEPFMRRFKDETDVPMLALDPVVGMSGNDNALFLPDDIHWNYFGNAVVAEALVDFIDEAAGW